MAQTPLAQTLHIALEHHQAGRLTDAEALYRQILSQQPNQSDALQWLGVLACQSGNYRAAIDLIGQAIAVNPAVAVYHNNLGETWRHSGKPGKAIEAYRKALALDANYADAHNNLGVALDAQNRLDDAIAAFTAATRSQPDHALAHYNLGNALARAARPAEARAAYRTAIRLRPRYGAALNNLGVLLMREGQLDDALASFRAAISAAPADPDAHLNLAEALSRKALREEAAGHYQAAIQLDPSRAAAHAGLACAHYHAGRLDEALAAFRKAIELDPRDAAARANLGATLRDSGRLDEAIASLRSAVEIDPAHAAAHSMLIFTLYVHPGAERTAIADEQRRWNSRHAAPLARAIAPHGNDPSPDRRLRVGYVSPDLRDHPVGTFMLPLMREHDRVAFEVTCYFNSHAPDALTGTLRGYADRWREVAALDDEALCRLIRDDRIDILVDLAMHTGANRLLAFARKPAPLQISYLAYCDGTGLSTMDYRIADRYTDPPGAGDDRPWERPLRLRDSYWCYAPAVVDVPVNALPALACGQVTFGCLNAFYKVNAAVVEAWGELLSRVPRSRLVLHAPRGSARDRVRELFMRHGVPSERIDLVARTPEREYFGQYNRIDIALDPFPYVGGTTTCDALWMGVPVVSLAGEMPTTRGGLSILSNVGLPELVARSREQYVELAVELASDLGRLSMLRSTLRERMMRSPLMDAPRHARDMEELYRSAWREWCAGQR